MLEKTIFVIIIMLLFSQRVVDNFDSYKWFNRLQLFYNIYNYFRKVYLF